MAKASTRRKGGGGGGGRKSSRPSPNAYGARVYSRNANAAFKIGGKAGTGRGLTPLEIESAAHSSGGSTEAK